MDEERMAHVHVPRATGGAGTRALERGGGQSGGDVPEEDAAVAEFLEDTGDVEVRPDEDLGGRVRLTDIREEEQRQESALATTHVDPPSPIDVVAAVDVPTGVPRIPRARKPNGNGSPRHLRA
jgi:hypothetical protein